MTQFNYCYYLVYHRLEIMETVSLYQEKAYDKLSRWAQNECQSLNYETPEISHLMRQAMKALKVRPLILKLVFTIYCFTNQSHFCIYFQKIDNQRHCTNKAKCNSKIFY